MLYGWSAARHGSAEGPGVIVTEGYMDVIALHRAGFTAAVAPLGTALTEYQLQELWRLGAGADPLLRRRSGGAAGGRPRAAAGAAVAAAGPAACALPACPPARTRIR